MTFRYFLERWNAVPALLADTGVFFFISGVCKKMLLPVPGAIFEFEFEVHQNTIADGALARTPLRAYSAPQTT